MKETTSWMFFFLIHSTPHSLHLSRSDRKSKWTRWLSEASRARNASASQRTLRCLGPALPLGQGVLGLGERQGPSPRDGVRILRVSPCFGGFERDTKWKTSSIFLGGGGSFFPGCTQVDPLVTTCSGKPRGSNLESGCAGKHSVPHGTHPRVFRVARRLVAWSVFIIWVWVKMKPPGDGRL